ncbi:hypothetical protein [Helicobacter cetorum]|uniref:hypothetical protein n=1 Tax=Helicobacter cetorum TaxID=138563 RepID=UPI000CF03849|nr:hypothetical protein [Helicobacter cetorum]
MSGCKYCKETKQESFEYQKHQLNIYKLLKDEQSGWIANFQRLYLQALSVLIVAPLGILWTLWTNADKLSLETIYFVIEMVLIFIAGFGWLATGKAQRNLYIKSYWRSKTLQTCLTHPKLSLRDLLTSEEREKNKNRLLPQEPLAIDQTSVMLYKNWIADFIIFPIYFIALFFLPLIAWLNSTNIEMIPILLLASATSFILAFMANGISNEPKIEKTSFYVSLFCSLAVFPIAFFVRIEVLVITHHSNDWSEWLWFSLYLVSFLLCIGIILSEERTTKEMLANFLDKTRKISKKFEQNKKIKRKNLLTKSVFHFCMRTRKFFIKLIWNIVFIMLVSFMLFIVFFLFEHYQWENYQILSWILVFIILLLFIMVYFFTNRILKNIKMQKYVLRILLFFSILLLGLLYVCFPYQQELERLFFFGELLMLFMHGKK